jgi:(p)ppGpp synthase/HD superfamily hydrolase
MRQSLNRDFTLVDLARAFAIAAHTAVNQKRKYTGEDYHVHPEEVLNILLTYHEPTPEEQAAALLHDIIEDTSTTRDHIARVFGQKVASLVVEVSDVSVKEDGNRKARKAKDLEHLAKASVQGMVLKCADLISNCKSIAKYDPSFAKTFLSEAMAILHRFEFPLRDELIYQKVIEVVNEAYQQVYPDPMAYYEEINKLQELYPNFVGRMTWQP